MNITTLLRTRPHTVNQSKIINLLGYVRPSSSQHTSADEKFVIPKRVPRSPTDILRALESTINRDPTAAHYKYHDDPFLIPMSNLGKRSFAMAQEAGRKAAQFIRREHADLFQHKVADPPIEMFAPATVYNENSDVSEKDLQQMIENRQIFDAKLVYNLLKSKQVEISPGTAQSLLELACFYNSEDKLADDLHEERWFKQSVKKREKLRKTWKDGDFADELFISFQNPGSEAYCALIQGMVKYYQAERAWQLFQEAQEKNIPLNTNTYNAIISITNFIKENYEMRWNMVVNLLNQMEQAKLKANLGTLNATMLAVVHTGSGKNARQNVMSILAEFKALGIEPSLATWYHVLTMFCREAGPTSTILYDIIAHLEDKSLTIKDLKDTHFFIMAMDVCRNHLGDANLARRVHKLLNYANNYDLIGDSFKESIYFRHYFCLLCANEPFEEFMRNTYQMLVPHIYVPEYGVMVEVLKQADLNCAVEFVPKLWSDVMVFDHAHRETIIDSVLNIMVNNPPQLVDSDLNEKFTNIAWDIFVKAENAEGFHKITLSGDNLGKILTVLSRNKDFDRACQVMEKLDKGHQTVVGVPKLEGLELFIDLCIENKAPSRAIKSIQYCSDFGFREASDLAKKLKSNLTLDENYLGQLEKIFGELP